MNPTIIHPTAIVDPNAKLGQGVQIGPYSIIGPNVVIGDNTIVENHVTIKGHTTIGKGNSIGAYSTIGFPPQDKKYKNEPTEVRIGDNNDIREYVSVHKGTATGTYLTEIGSNNQIMVHCHFAHDTRLGSNCMLANSTGLAGHVELGSFIVTGGFAVFHQFCKVGNYCMVGGLSAVVQDLAPFMLAAGGRAKLHGINKIGLSRNGFSPTEIHDVTQIYKIMFRKGFTQNEAIAKIETEFVDSRVKKEFLEFIKTSKRGLLR